jgi:biopolymer transport protein ExbD
MRSNSPLIRGAGETDLNTAMTPMIDVVFLLLVFFVWTASFQTIEFIMPPSELSSQMGSEPDNALDEPPPSDFEDIVVRIQNQNGGPAWKVNTQPLASIDQVKIQLQKLANIDTSVVVILHPDPEIQLEHVIGAYDTALSVGFAKVSFAVN